MLTPEQFEEYCQKNNLTQKGKARANRIRTTPPVRPVKGYKNRIAYFASRLMGCMIQSESDTVELQGILGYEYIESRQDLFEYWDQPDQIHLRYEGKNGRGVGHLHTPDFFCVRKNELGYEEWKDEKQLIELSLQVPHRYIKEANGVWRCPPGEEAAKEDGFYYRMRLSSEINWILQTNIQYFANYWRPECPPVNDNIAEKVKAVVADNQGLKLDRLQNLLREVSADDINTLIAHTHLYVDLAAAPLNHPHRVRVFTDRDIAVALTSRFTEPDLGLQKQQVIIQPGMSLLLDKRPIYVVTVGETQVFYRFDDTPDIDPHLETINLHRLTHDQIRELVERNVIEGLQASEIDNDQEQKLLDLLKKKGRVAMEKALERFLQIEPLLRGEGYPDGNTPRRTLRDWKRKYLEAEKEYGNGLFGLIDGYDQCGHTSPYTDATIEFAENWIKENYETARLLGKAAALRAYTDACEEAGITDIKEKKFRELVDARSGPRQTTSRFGTKAGKNDEPTILFLDYHTPRHGLYPFHYAHIDSTVLDVELVHSVTGKNMGRPHLTIATDAYTRRILAVYLSFDSPSIRTLMMVIRIIAKRYKRMPDWVICDHGSEFESKYFKAIMASFGTSIKFREKARDGGVIESMFKVINKLFVHTLMGNTQIRVRVREVTKLVDPDNLAIWFLEALYVAFDMWADELYDNSEHPALGESPKEAVERAPSTVGERKYLNVIKYDKIFTWLTMPWTKQKFHTIVRNRGIKFNYTYYWSDAMRDYIEDKQPLESKTATGNTEKGGNQKRVKRKKSGTKVEVRYDPFNIGIVYALIRGRWEPCYSEYYSELRDHSFKELEVATEELRRQKKQSNSRRRTITGKQIAIFFKSVRGQEVLLEQATRDLEAAAIRAFIDAPGIWSIRKFQGVPQFVQDAFVVKTPQIEELIDDKPSTDAPRLVPKAPKSFSMNWEEEEN